jgi:Ran GTPase-activating protein (RanGAP) involved in mRNA processing and transport
VSLTKLVLSRISADTSVVIKFGKALEENKSHSIQVLDLSNNRIHDKGLLQLCHAIKSFNHALIHLNLSNCALTSKGISYLMTALEFNWGVSLSIEYLNLSNNKLDDHGSLVLERWLLMMKEHSR